MPGDHPLSWHERRRRGIGSSDIAGVLGISAWASPYSVWLSKIGSDTPGSERMRWGNLLEDVVLDEAARRLDVDVTGRQVEAQHPRHEWAIATLDATYAERRVAVDKGALEIKTTGEASWDEVPAKYEAQVQWQLEVRQLPVAWVACLHGGQKLSLWRVERDEETGADLLEIAGAFWERHVVAGIPPELDGAQATTDALSRRYAVTVPELTADLGGLRDVIARVRENNRAIKAMEAENDELKNRLRAALGSAEAGVIDGEPAITWRPHGAPHFDSARFREEHPALAEEYTTVKTVRPLRVGERGTNA